MQTIDSRDIKKYELELLKAFKAACDKRQLKWYLGGGTLLGAIRHKGFIPWDDDIDVMMPREDYSRFLKICRHDFPEHMKLIDYQHGTNDYPYAKLIDRRIAIEEENMSSRFSHNLWIDIFPIDGNPEDDREYFELCRRIAFYRKLLVIGIYKNWHGTTFFRKLLKAVILGPAIRTYGLKRICKRIDRLCTKYNVAECNQVGCLVWGYGTKERVEKEGFMRAAYAEFEGVRCPIPSNYDEYLTKHYGDYMKMPPESERETHGIRAWWEET